VPRERAGEGECHRGDQNIAAGAMNERGHDLLPGAALPECVKRQLDRLPDKMAK